MDRQELAARLKGGIFVSTMLGVIDGRTAARIGRHASMIQLGALFKEKNHWTHDPRFVLPKEEYDYAELLRRELEPIREALGTVPVCWNTAAGDVDSACRFAAAAEMAGADLYELNFNGGYGKIIKKSTIRAMVLPHNRRGLTDWLRELTDRATIPIVVKVYTGMHGVDFGRLAEDLSGLGLFGLHLNVRGVTTKGPNAEMVAQVRPRFGGLLLASGRVVNRRQLDWLLAAGAGCVGVAQGLVFDPELISKLVKQGRRHLRSRSGTQGLSGDTD